MATDRTPLDFVRAIRRSFGYLCELGFVETSNEPTLVRFNRGDVDVDVYHGRMLYEINVGVSWAGERFGMVELLKIVRPTIASSYRVPAATTAEQTSRWVAAVAEQFEAAAPLLLDALPVALKVERQRAAKALELDVLASQVRPKADAAFRDKKYAEAVRLYLFDRTPTHGCRASKARVGRPSIAPGLDPTATCRPGRPTCRSDTARSGRPDRARAMSGNPSLLMSPSAKP